LLGNRLHPVRPAYTPIRLERPFAGETRKGFLTQKPKNYIMHGLRLNRLRLTKLMSGLTVINNLEFARHGAVLQGEIFIAKLGRLQESLLSDQGVLNYTLTGKIGAKGESLLVCSIEGKLVLQCQRCLGALEYPLHILSTLKVVENVTEFDDPGDEDESVDSVPASAAMDVQGLIEEEILLNLPLSPVHSPEACREQGAAEAAKNERTNPFSALTALKGKL